VRRWPSGARLNGKPNYPGEDKSRNPYEKPTVTILVPEEPKLKVVNLAKRGDRGAKEMLEMMLTEKAERLSTDKKKSA
jgi:hypothetical protein